MQLNNKKIIVTGGAGFIGSHVVDQLIEKNNDVIIIDNFSTGKIKNIEHNKLSGHLQVIRSDIRDLKSMLSLIKDADIVIHMAVACLRTSINDPILVHEINTKGTLNVCYAAHKNNIEKLIYISSSEAYGSALYVPMDEEHPLNPTTIYGASKAAGEFYTLAYYRTYGLPVVVVRPFNAYGPRAPDRGYRAEVIPKFVMRSLAGIQPVIFGNGHQTRDFTWVEDTARGIIMAAECDELIGDRVNIASGQEVSIEEISLLVLQKNGTAEMKPEYLEIDRPGDLDRHCADITKANKVMGYTPTVQIEDGVDKYIKWVKTQNYDLQEWVHQERAKNW